MHILVAADADYVVADVVAALSGPDVSFTVCKNGRDVTAVVKARTPDLAVLDLQIGSKGAMAVTMDLRLDESGGRLSHVKVLMLLDRTADVHLAKRCGAEAWLVKPVDPLTLRLTAKAVITDDLDMSEPDDQVAGADDQAQPGPRRWKRKGGSPGAESAEEQPVAAG